MERGKEYGAYIPEMRPKRYKYDVVVIGGGPNGLVAASYLSKAGQKVAIVDRRGELGGGLATEEPECPGFLFNTHAIYMMMVDFAPPYKDLELEKVYGLKHGYPPLQFAMPFLDGSCLCIYSDLERTCKSIAQFSKRDSDTYREIYNKYKEYVDNFIAPATYVQPLPVIEQAAKLERTEMGREIASLSEKTPKDLVYELFEEEHVRALMLYICCMWGLDPEQAGVGYLVPLYINRASNYRLCVNGSHSLTQALNKVILENGGHVFSPRKVGRIMVSGGEARGVELADGTIIEAGAVISTLDLHQTFLDLVKAENLEREFVETLKVWQYEHWSLLGVHLALEAAPQFTAARSNPEINNAFVYVLGYESPDDFLRHYKLVEEGRLDERCGFNCCFPSLHDPSQAPPGRHTGLISQMAPYGLEGDRERWYPYKFRIEMGKRALELLKKYAPNMTQDKIRAVYVSTPLDVENKFPDMVKGSIKQGQYHPLQMGYNRPNAECSQHRSPIKGLYMGGACTYPGGTVLLGSGYLAANAVAEDLGIKRWWSEPEMVTRARQSGLL